MERRMALAVAAAGALMAGTGAVGAHGLLTSSDGPAAHASDAASAGAPQESTTSLVPVTVTEKRDVFDLVVVPTAPASPPAVAAVRVDEPEHLGDSEESSDDESESEPTTSAPSTTAVSSSSPSMPPGCIDGELEDDGRWNCQSSEHDD